MASVRRGGQRTRALLPPLRTALATTAAPLDTSTGPAHASFDRAVKMFVETNRTDAFAKNCFAAVGMYVFGRRVTCKVRGGGG